MTRTFSVRRRTSEPQDDHRAGEDGRAHPPRGRAQRRGRDAHERQDGRTDRGRVEDVTAAPREHVLRQRCHRPGERDPGERRRDRAWGAARTAGCAAVISDDSSRHGSCMTAWEAASTPTHTAESTAGVARSSSGVGATSWKKETAKATSASARQREQHQPVHRDAAEHREDAVPQRGEGSDHTNNSAVLPGDHSTRPSVVIRTHSHAPLVGQLRPAVEEQGGRDRVRAHRRLRDRPRRGDRAHRLAGARIEHVVQAVAPRAPVRRRRAERGIRHLDDADRAAGVVRMLQRDALRGAAHREVAARVDDERHRRCGAEDLRAPGRRAGPCRARRRR